MEMRSGHSAGAADPRDDFAARDLLAVAHQVDLVMRVDGNDSSAMADNHHIAVTTELVAVNDLAVLDRTDRGSFRRADVETVMETRAARPEA